jgi:hypothetical protein
MPLARRRRPRRRRRRRRRSRWCRPRGCVLTPSPRTGWRSRTARPRCRGSRPTGRTGRRPLEAAPGQHPLDLLGHEKHGGQRGRVVGLVQLRVVEARLQVEEGRDPPVRGRQFLDPVEGGRGEQSHPQAAVGGEALLRGEVVGVELRTGRSAARPPPRWRPPPPGRRPTSGARAPPVGGWSWPHRSRSRCGSGRRGRCRGRPPLRVGPRPATR